MPIEVIRRYPVAEADRQAVQDRVIKAVEGDPERFLQAYGAREESKGGRYICADLFKETFEDYRASRESRTRYNNVVHASAAVLSAEQFRRVIALPQERGCDRAVFLTGVPGAGKTSLVMDKGLAASWHVVFEGQLVSADGALKVGQALDAGLRPLVIAVHPRPENALEFTLQRYERSGRGASIESMARIQGGTPDGLAAILDRFGDRVDLVVYDARDRDTGVQRHQGWAALDILRSEGDHARLSQRLSQDLERRWEAGAVSPGGYQQARGLHRPRDRSLAPGSDDRDGSDAPGPGAPRSGGEAPLLEATTPSGRLLAERFQRSTPAERARDPELRNVQSQFSAIAAHLRASTLPEFYDQVLSELHADIVEQLAQGAEFSPVLIAEAEPEHAPEADSPLTDRER